MFWGAVVVAAPFYWMGFIERETEWLGVGVAVVIAARLLVRVVKGPSGRVVK